MVILATLSIFLIPLIIFGLGYIIIEFEYYGDLPLGIITIIILIFCLFFSFMFSNKLLYIKEEKKYTIYEMEREIILDSLQDERITGFERMALIKQINEYNSKLIRLKINAKQWWNWHIDDNRVNKMEYIELNKEEEDYE